MGLKGGKEGEVGRETSALCSTKGGEKGLLPRLSATLAPGVKQQVSCLPRPGFSDSLGCTDPTGTGTPRAECPEFALGTTELRPGGCSVCGTCPSPGACLAIHLATPRCS